MKPERTGLGFLEWYDHVPIYLTFRGQTLEKWFREGESQPCLMRGSIYALRHGKGHGERVFKRQIMRWVRLRRITALTMTEWQGIAYRDFWEKKAERLQARYGRFSWLDTLEFLVDAAPDRPFPRYPCHVLVDGTRFEVEEERLKALREMQALDRKMRKAA